MRTLLPLRATSAALLCPGPQPGCALQASAGARQDVSAECRGVRSAPGPCRSLAVGCGEGAPGVRAPQEKSLATPGPTEQIP
jgi:hypothetical protein